MKLISDTFTIKKIPKVVWSSEDSFNLKPKPLTFIFLVFGLFLFGLGESLLITSGAGVGPYTVLAQGISNLTNWSLGAFYICDQYFCSYVVDTIETKAWNGNNTKCFYYCPDN